jgi:hypothetical protein
MSGWRCRHGVGAGDWCDDCNMPAVVDVVKSWTGHVDPDAPVPDKTGEKK